MLQRNYLCERIHDLVSATWIAFNGKLLGFRMKFFKKQEAIVFCLFIHNTNWKHDLETQLAFHSSYYSHASLLRRCQRIFCNFFFRVQLLGWLMVAQKPFFKVTTQSRNHFSYSAYHATSSWLCLVRRKSMLVIWE